jgi:flagellar motor switch protein FliG
MSYDRSDRIRRAAILVASLDEPLAEQLLGELPPVERERVLTAAERLEEIDPDEQRDVLAEFRRLSRGARTKDAREGAVEVAFSGSEGARHGGSSTSNREGGTAASEAPALAEGDAAAMAELLSHEHPQIIAAALARLGDEQCAGVFAALPPYLQAETLERLASLAPPDEEAVHEVESQLQQRLQQRREHQARSAAGAELVRKLLAHTPAAQRVVLLERLGNQERPRSASLPPAAVDPLAQQAKNLAQAVRRARAAEPNAPEAPPLEDRSEDLALLSDEALVTALHQAGEQVVLRALAASGDEFLDRVAAMLPRRQARKLRNLLRDLGPTRLADLHAAQYELLRLAHHAAAVEAAA